MLRIAEQNPSVAQALLGKPWMESDIGQQEIEAIIYLSLMTDREPAVARKVVGFSWFSDGISREDAVALLEISRVSNVSGSVALELSELPWLADGVGRHELQAIRGIYSLAGQEYALQEFPLSFHVLGLPWIVDGINEEEGQKLEFLTYLPLAVIDAENRVYEGPTLAALEAILSVDPENDVLDEGVFLAFEEMDPIKLFHRGWRSETFEPSAVLAGQPWFRDGFSDDEKALITSFRSILRSGQSQEAERILEQLIEHGEVHSESFTSPSAGSIDVYVVSRALIPADQDIFSKLRSRISTGGGPAGHPSLVAQVILLVDPELRTCFPKIQLGAVVDEQSGGSRSMLTALRDELEEFRSDLTAGVQTVYPGEVFEEYGAAPVEEALDPLGDALQWVAVYDNVTQRWVVFDPGGTFTLESLPLPARVPVPDWSTVGELTHLIPRLIYWMNVDQDRSVVLGGETRNLSAGTNPVIW